MSAFKGFSENQIEEGEGRGVGRKDLGKVIIDHYDPHRISWKIFLEGAKKVKKSGSPVKVPAKEICDVPQEALLSCATITSTRTADHPPTLDPDILTGTSTDSPKVEVLHKRQKEIEEENNKKRKLLLDTINERFLADV